MAGVLKLEANNAINAKSRSLSELQKNQPRRRRCRQRSVIERAESSIGLSKRKDAMASKTRVRLLVAMLLIIVLIPTVLVISGLLASYHASVVRHRGASVDYGVKGGYFVALNETEDLPTFLANCGASLNYLSEHYPLVIRLDERDLTNTDLGALKQIKGTFYLSLRNAKIDESQFVQLIAISNLLGVETTNTVIPEVLLERFNQSRLQ